MRSSFLLIFFLLCSEFIVTSCKKTEDNSHYEIINFESLPVPQVGYWNGSDASGSFTANNMKFVNQYNPDWKTWDGFSYSQKNDFTTAGYENQYSVVDPANKNNKYAIFYPSFGSDIFASFPAGEENIIQSIDLCNNTYAALSMKNGDSYCKKFGGTTGADPDWFKVTINGYNTNGVKVGSLDVYLADFRPNDSSKDYILTKWTTFDLTSLGVVNKLSFVFASTDNGAYGVNTPTYLCLDNIKFKNSKIIL